MLNKWYILTYDTFNLDIHVLDYNRVIQLAHTCWRLWLRTWLETIYLQTNTSNLSIIQTPCIGKLISASTSTKLLPTGLLYFGRSKGPSKILVSNCSGKKDLDFFFFSLYKKFYKCHNLLNWSSLVLHGYMSK